MDKGRAQDVIQANLGPYMEALGILHWDITVRLEPVPPGRIQPAGYSTKGGCVTHEPYNSALIFIDPAEIEDEEHLLKVFLHELCHVVLAPFNVYRHWATGMIRAGSSLEAQEDRIWEFHVEQAVINLERMFRGVRKHAQGLPGAKPAPAPEPPATAPDASPRKPEVRRRRAPKTT